MAYASISFVYGETPSASKWNILGTNDASFNDGTGIAVSAITPEKLLTGTGASWAWQTWTPTWTNLTVGNGTQSAAYCQIGKTIFFRLKLVFGTTTSITGVDPRVTPPVTINTTYSRVTMPYGHSLYFDTSGPSYFLGYCGVAQIDNTKIQPWLYTTASSYAQVTGYTTVAPVAFGTGDEIFFTGFYEAA